MQRFKNILCVIEHGEASEPALGRAVELAENNQASLMVVDVIPRIPNGMRMPDGGPTSSDLQTAMVHKYEERMEGLITPYRQRLNIQHKVLFGTSFLEVIREVLRNGHDLVIKCPEAPTWLNRLFAGDDMNLLRKCPCPVWLIKPHAPRSYSRILAAVDVDDFYPSQELKTRQLLNVQILETAASLALSEFAELHIVHTWEPMAELIDGLVFSSDTSREKFAYNIDQARRQQQQLLDELIRNSKSNVTRDAMDHLKPLTHLLKGQARKEIPSLAKHLEIDCIVMGTVARTGIRGFIMGNTAETILEQVDCSVLALKPQGFVTPVTLDA
ncbi:universal stress protein [Halomonas sp. YLGW01]|uniref:universal stress protein n=1 Tax=Halomonas sp. YLGW01 TaxID=2773308 RepID=UPI00177D5F8F|nr:universal stress protein [Halomonas sp. YLGW01]